MPSRRLWKPCGIRNLLFENGTAISANFVLCTAKNKLHESNSYIVHIASEYWSAQKQMYTVNQ